MKKIEVWYTIEKCNKEYVVWMNKEGNNSCGSFGLYKGKKKDCINYCKNNNIQYEK